MCLIGLIKFGWRTNTTDVSRQPKTGSLPKLGRMRSGDLGFEGGGAGQM